MDKRDVLLGRVDMLRLRLRINLVLSCSGLAAAMFFSENWKLVLFFLMLSGSFLSEAAIVRRDQLEAINELVEYDQMPS